MPSASASASCICSDMKDLYRGLTYAINGAGIMVSVGDIESVVSIILLTLSILNILVTFGLRIYDLVKEKRYDEIPDEIKEATEDIKEVIEDAKDDKGSAE